MEKFITTLQREVQEKLEHVDPGEGPSKGYDKKIEIITEAILAIRHYLTNHPFPDKETEIKYFKHWAPPFYKQYFYFTAMCSVETSKAICDRNAFLELLEEERKQVAEFLRRNRELHAYYYSRRSNEDEKLFVHAPLFKPKEFLTMDHQHCEASLILGELMAGQKYKDALEHELYAMNESENDQYSGVKWMGTDAENAEFIAAAVESLLLTCNGEPATIAQARAWMKEKLNADINNFSVVDNKNRNRKVSSTPLLDRIIQAYNKRKDRLDP